MSARLRPVLSSLPVYRPGRTVAGAIKLASNETPYPPLPYVVERVAMAGADANRYPDTNATVLSRALAEHVGVQPGQIVVGCGSVSLCAQLVQATCDAGDEVIYAWRSFEAYPLVTAVNGAVSVQVPLRGFVHDLDEMASRITDRTRLVLICNPNNPTGTVVSRDALTDFLRKVPENVVVALDEAYREFVTEESVPDGITLLDEHANVVVLRTFSKAYGLAGLRVGYAVAADLAVASGLRQTQVPFAVTTAAQSAAVASLQAPATQQLRERVVEVVTERGRLRAALRALGYEVPPTQGNFVWLPLGAATQPWAAECEQRGIIVRAYSDDGVRITIGTPDENDRVIGAATELAQVDGSRRNTAPD